MNEFFSLGKFRKIRQENDNLRRNSGAECEQLKDIPCNNSFSHNFFCSYKIFLLSSVDWWIILIEQQLTISGKKEIDDHYYNCCDSPKTYKHKKRLNCCKKIIFEWFLRQSVNLSSDYWSETTEEDQRLGEFYQPCNLDKGLSDGSQEEREVKCYA